MYRQKPRCAPFSDESRREPRRISRARSIPWPAAFAYADGFMSRGCEPYGLASAAVQRSRYTSVGVQILTPLWVPNCLNTSAPGYRILKIAPIDHAAHPRVVDGATDHAAHPRVVDGATVSVAATCLASRAHRIGEEAPDSAPEPPRPSVAVPRPSPARSRTGGDELDPGRSRAQGVPVWDKVCVRGGT
jgi:hypothetical protein